MKRGSTAFEENGAVARSEGGQRSLTWLVAIPFFILGSVFSLWYVEAYSSGDAVAYTRFYDVLFRLPTQHWSFFQRSYIGSAEPLYRYLIALGAYYGIDRVVYISAWNGIFIGVIGYILVKHRCSLIFCFFVFTNFYLLVLLGSAERLKFSYIALVLAFAIDNRKLRLLLAAVSPFFHTQAAVQFASAGCYFIAANLRRFALTPLRSLFFGISGLATLIAISYLFYATVGQVLEVKVDYYASESGGVVEAMQWGMLVVAGLVTFKNRLGFFAGMLPMGILTILFGNRVNVATLALFVALAILQRKTKNPIVLAVMAYMSFKSVEFLSGVIRFGDGFLG